MNGDPITITKNITKAYYYCYYFAEYYYYYYSSITTTFIITVEPKKHNTSRSLLLPWYRTLRQTHYHIKLSWKLSYKTKLKFCGELLSNRESNSLTPRMYGRVLKCYFIACHVSSAKDKLCITAPPGVVAYSVTSTGISFFIAQQNIKTHLFEL